MFVVGKDECIILNQCIYGLVSGLVVGNVNPCLHIKKSANGLVHISLYIDDNLVVGNIETIDNAILALNRNGMVLKIMERMQDYLSGEIKFLIVKKRTWLKQPHFINNLNDKFGKCVKDVCNHKTPDTPKFLIVRPMEESEEISTKDEWEYLLGVGMLLYLVKHSCPDLANGTRELLKANDGANPAAFKELLHLIKYVLDKDVALKIEPTENYNKPWDIVCFSNSDYAGDPVSR